MNSVTWTGDHAAEWAGHYGGQVIDLDKPTGYFEVSVEHYAEDLYAVNAGCYSVDVNRGLGCCTVYQTDSKDKALGVAEYLEGVGRYDRGPDGEYVTNEGEPFTDSIRHRDWDCTCGQPRTSEPVQP